MHEWAPYKIRKFLYRRYLSFNHSLKFLERIQIHNPDQKLSQTPIFIIGAPRTGSTLLYQTLLTAFDLAYISNLHCIFFGCPWLIERVFKPSRFYRGSGFHSNRGSISGWNAPSECGEFWYRFFRRNPQFVTSSNTDKQNLKELRIALHALVNAANKTFLIKNLPCSVRLDPLHHILPEAIYIVIHRNEIDAAQSILAQRKVKHGSYQKWFSVEPPDIDQLKKEPVHIQAIEQIRSIYRFIKEREKEIGASKFLHVQYEDLCDNPNAIKKRLHSFFKTHKIKVRDRSSLPDYFDPSSKRQIPSSLYSKLVNYAESN